MVVARAALSLVVLAAGCSTDTNAIPTDPSDATTDSSVGDGGIDSTAPDADSGSIPPPDGSPPDGGMPDASPPDGAVMDTACPDGDGDGICDSVDACPGGDDRDDADGDGTPDDCDDCPIDGPLATPIPTSVSSTATGITITNVSLDGGGNVVTVDGGASVSISLDYSIMDCGCPGCIDQIEIGLVPGPTYQYCAYSAVPGCGGDTGSDSESLTAPSAPGVYYVRFGRAQNFGCDHADWWMGTPPEGRTIGALCVR